MIMSISEIKNTAFGKMVVLFAALALVASLAFGASVARAQTTAELQAQIQTLLAQITALQAQLGAQAQPAAGFRFERDLRLGSTGQDVLELQRFLNRNAATQVAPAGSPGGPGMETSFYGPATAAAVSRYQALHASAILAPLGLTAPTGSFGPSTRAHVNAATAVVVPPVTPPVTPPTPPADPVTPPAEELRGGEGWINVRQVATGPVTITLGSDARIYEFSVEARDADVAVNRIDLLFSHRPWLYFTEVRLLSGGEEIGRLRSSDDFTSVGANWRARFTGLNEIIREDNAKTFTVEVGTPAVLLPAHLAAAPVNVHLAANAVRAVDAARLVINEPGAPLAITPVSFTAQAAGGLAVVLNRNTPTDRNFIVTSTTADTNDQVVAIYDMRATGQDVVVRGATFNLTIGGGPALATTEPNDPHEVTRRFRLYAGERLLGTAVAVTTAAHTGTVTFTNFEHTIARDATAVFTLEADFAPLAAGATRTILATLPVAGLTAEGARDFAATPNLAAPVATQAIPAASEALITTLLDKRVATSTLGTQTIGTATFEIGLRPVGRDFWLPGGTTTPTAAARMGLVPSVVGNVSVIDTSVEVRGETLSTPNSNFRLVQGRDYTLVVTVTVQAVDTTPPNTAVTNVTLLSFISSATDAGGTLAVPPGTLHTLGVPIFQSANMTVHTP
jgi:hypothetical protein